MARLTDDLLIRVEGFCDRVLDVAEHLATTKRAPRIVSQLIGCGNSGGASLFEADEAMSRADFCRCLSIAIKELNETRYWLRLFRRRAWIGADRLEPLMQEAEELKRMPGSMVARSRARATTSSHKD